MLNQSKRRIFFGKLAGEVKIQNITAFSNLGLVAHFDTDSAFHALVHSVAMRGWVVAVGLPSHTF